MKTHKLNKSNCNTGSRDKSSILGIVEAFGLAAHGGSAPAFVSAIAWIQDTKKEYYVYATISDLLLDTTIKAGVIVRTAGYYAIGDGGGAEFVIVNDKGDKPETINTRNNLYASVITPNNQQLFHAFRNPEHLAN